MQITDGLTYKYIKQPQKYTVSQKNKTLNACP